MKPIYVAFASKRLEASFEKLKCGDANNRELYSEISKAIEKLKFHEQGVKLPTRVWPKEYLKSVDITNLWKYNLRNGWRILYTVKTDEIMIVKVILEYFRSHKEYEMKFKYNMM